MRWVLLALAACGSSTGGGGTPTQAEAAKACVMFGSCMVDDGVDDCMTDILPTLPPDAVRCMGEAADCATALGCIGMSQTLRACSPTGYTCTNGTETYCDVQVVQTVECGSPLSTGPTCVTGTNHPACGAGTCSPGARACAGEHTQSCDPNGVLEDVDCAALGFTCAGGVCTEVGGGGACTTPNMDHCEGTQIVKCDSTGTEVRIDCAKRIAGSTCHVAAGHSEAYCGFGDECYPAKGTEVCTGSVMTYCANGVIATIDCTSIGLTQCSTATNGCF